MGESALSLARRIRDCRGNVGGGVGDGGGALDVDVVRLFGVGKLVRLRDGAVENIVQGEAVDIRDKHGVVDAVGHAHVREAVRAVKRHLKSRARVAVAGDAVVDC